jgi:hypothetical protein
MKPLNYIETQVARFARLFVVALGVQLAALGGTDHLGRSAIVAALVGAAEVAWRQLRPAAPAPPL